MLRRDSSTFLDAGDPSPRSLGKIVIVPIAAHLGLLILFDLGQHLVLSLLLVGVGFLGVLMAERLLHGYSRRTAFWVVLAVAASLRTLLLPLPLTLSEDAERYLWDGRVLSAGFNPYELPPEAQELTPLRDSLWEGLPHRQVATVYPPLAEALFALSAQLPVPIVAWKTILVLLDLGTCGMLLLLARLWSLPPTRTLWYAWNPLVTVEVAGMGHVDGLGVALVVATTTLLVVSPPRVGRAGLAAAAAVLAKLIPVLAIPVWVRQSDRKVLFVAVTLGVCVAGILPVLVVGGGIPPGLIEYGMSWEFNGPVFEPLWRGLDWLQVSAAVESGLDRLKDLTGRHELLNHLYPFNYPQFWAKLVLAFGLLVSLIWAWRTPNTARSLNRVFGSVLIFSATVYPWYALWVLPWAALRRQSAWLALSGLLFLTYVPQIWEIPLFPWLQAVVWLPFVFLLLRGVPWSTR